MSSTLPASSFLLEGDAFVAAGLDGGREKFGEGDAGEDEQSAGSAAAAEAFSVEEEGGEPGEDRLEREDEGGMGSGEKFLGPGLDGESGGCGEDGGDEERDEDGGGPVDPGAFEEGEAGGHEDGTESDLKDGELLEGNARGEMRKGQDVKGKAEGTAEGEEVAETDGAERKACTGGSGEQDDAGEGDEGSCERVPAWRVRGARAEAGNGGEQLGEHWNQDDDHAGDEGGFRRCGETKAGGLELIAQSEAEADDGAGEEGVASHASEVAAVEDGQAEEGQGHADEVEQEGGDGGERVLDDDEGRAPDGDDDDEKDVSAQGAGCRRRGVRHGGRVAGRQLKSG